MRKINWIVVHKSETPNGRKVTREEIDKWHRENGWKRLEGFKKNFNPKLTSIGYQYVIYIDGSVLTGRSEEEIPVAVRKHNIDSINICLIGNGRYTKAQWESLKKLVKELEDKYPNAVTVGHYSFDTAKEQGKTCPSFDVLKWVFSGFTPEKENIYTSEE